MSCRSRFLKGSLWERGKSFERKEEILRTRDISAEPGFFLAASKSKRHFHKPDWEVHPLSNGLFSTVSGRPQYGPL